MLVSDCGLSAECIREILQAIGDNVCLFNFALDISYNYLNQKMGKPGFFEKLNAGVQEVILGLPRSKNLRALNISGMRLGIRGSTLMLQNLPPALQILLIDDNIQDGERDSAAEFYEALAVACRQIKSLSIAGDHRVIGPGLKSFFPYLAENSNLIHLDISNQKLGDDSFLQLCQSLFKNKSLVSLNIRNNDIGLNGALGLLAALKHNNSLSQIELINFEKDYSKFSPRFEDLNKAILRAAMALPLPSLDKLKVNWKFALNWEIPVGPPEPLSEVPEFLRQLEATAQTLLISESKLVGNTEETGTEISNLPLPLNHSSYISDSASIPQESTSPSKSQPHTPLSQSTAVGEYDEKQYQNNGVDSDSW